MENKPVVTRDKTGWRVDLPNGDYCYQPSEEFARAYARRWNMFRMPPPRYRVEDTNPGD